MKIVKYLAKQSNTALACYGLLLFLVIGILDCYSGPELGVSIFYLLPISLATWFLGLGGWLAASLAGVLN